METECIHLYNLAKAHLRTGDMSFVEDVTGKGHRTLEKGAQSVFVRVPEGFDVKKWAAGQ